MYHREKQDYIEDFRLVAHRGLHDLAQGAPENSMAAFQRGVDRGVAMELDIHLTADGQLAVLHDSGLKRMCGVPGKVEEWTLEDLKKLRLKNTPETIPTLPEVLDLVDGRVPLLIEIKNDGTQPAGRLERVLTPLLDRYAGPFILESFYPPVLCWLRKNAPRFIRGQLGEIDPNDRFHRMYVKHLMFNPLTRPDFIAFDIQSIDHRLRLACKRHKTPLFGWTIRTEEQREKAGRLCDGMIYEKLNL